MRVRPVSPELLVDELAELVASTAATTGRLRVAVDGAPEAGTAELTAALVDPLRVRGHETVHISTADYLRPASLRLEHGHHDPESYHSDWFDFDGLHREVLRPLEPDGTQHVLPALWDPTTDRSPRLARVPVPERGVVLVEGPLLLGRALPFDLTVHLWLPQHVLDKRIAEDRRWTLPAFERYTEQHAPELRADFVVRVDRPGRPAVVDQW